MPRKMVHRGFRMSDSIGVHILEIRDSKAGSYEVVGLDEFNIRAYLTQCGFTVTNVALKASGHVFVTCTGIERDVEAAWAEYEPSKVNPASLLVQQMLELRKVLPKLQNGTATMKEKDSALTTIVELALKAYGVPDS